MSFTPSRNPAAAKALIVASIFGMAGVINADMATPYNVYGGLQDNGSWREPAYVWENGGIRNHHWDEVAFGDGFAIDHRGHRLRQLDGSAGTGNRSRDDMLRHNHRGGLQHFDVLVGVILWCTILHYQHAEHLPAALNRYSQQRVIDLLAGLRPI